jgi:ankyrin repeat protein
VNNLNAASLLQEKKGSLIKFLHKKMDSGQICEAILMNEQGKDLIDVPDENGWTLLHKAVDNGNNSAVKILLKHGANPTIKTPKDNTALSLITTRKEKDVSLDHPSIAKELLEHMTAEAINEPTADEKTAVEHALEQGHQGILDIFIASAKIDRSLLPIKKQETPPPQTAPVLPALQAPTPSTFTALPFTPAREATAAQANEPSLQTQITALQTQVEQLQTQLTAQTEMFQNQLEQQTSMLIKLLQTQSPQRRFSY